MLNTNLPILVTLARCSNRLKSDHELLIKQLQGRNARRLGRLLVADVVEAETHDLTTTLAAIRSLAGVPTPAKPRRPAKPKFTLFSYLRDDWT